MTSHVVPHPEGRMGQDPRIGGLVARSGIPNLLPDGIVSRQLPELPFIDLVPSAELMPPLLREQVMAMGTVSLTLFTTRRAEDLLHKPSSAPLVLIIVPTYNCASYIRETLRSIQTQNYAATLIVIVDDESTDDTRQRVRQLMSESSDVSAIAFTSIPHVGNPGLTRNIGIFNLAPPEVAYIGFMDGDDLYASDDAITSLVDALELNPDKVAAFGDYDWIRSDGTQLAPPCGLRRQRDGSLNWSNDRRLTWRTFANGSVNVFHFQCLMVRKGAPFLPYRPRGEDVEYYANLIGTSTDDGTDDILSLVQIPKLIAHYRRHGASYSHDTHKYVEPGTFRRSLDGVPVPWIYEWAHVPDRYITKELLGEFFLRRHLRECIRAVFQRNWRGAWGSIRQATQDRFIRKSSLLTLPLREFWADPAIRATLAFATSAVGLRNTYERRSRVPSA